MRVMNVGIAGMGMVMGVDEIMGRVSSVQMSSADAAETEQWRVPLRQQVGPLYSLSEPGSLAATVSFSIPVAPSNCSASLHTLC